MPDTTIKVDSTVRDRLAVLAAQRGTTIRDLVAELARATPTAEELSSRRAAAEAYVARHLVPGFGDADLAAGERLWQQLEASGRPAADDRGMAG